VNSSSLASRTAIEIFGRNGAGRSTGGGVFSRRHIHEILSNPVYVGRIAHKDQIYEGHHRTIVTLDLWDDPNPTVGGCGGK
jgi:site-specific DNA recombinase